METEMQKFYKGSKVFVTGVTGFLGKVFIEKLLRATEVDRVYVLIRPKRGKGIEERIEALFKDPLFDKLHALRPQATKRITPIFGDCTYPNLGLSPEDRDILVDNVEIVIHTAATVRFNEPIGNALQINVRATLELLSLAKKMFNLKAFVHTSSAFANCIYKHIEERYYVEKIGVSAEKMCQIADSLGPDELNAVTDKYAQGFPNTYCFTKALAEEAVMSHGNELPICIFRPGIVSTTYREPISGWIDNLTGPTGFLYGSLNGVLRVVYARITTRANVVPVDLCANAMLACAWATAKSVHKNKTTPPPIYNYVPDDSNYVSWLELLSNTMKNYVPQMPLSSMMWFPIMVHTHSKLVYTLMTFFYHTIPGYIIDFALLVMGKKPRMSKLYRTIDLQCKLLFFFLNKEFTFSTENTKGLWNLLSTEDQELFQFDTKKINWTDYTYNGIVGLRRYLCKEEPATIPQGLKLYKRLKMLHHALQVIVYGGGLMVLYWGCTKMLQWL